MAATEYKAPVRWSFEAQIEAEMYVQRAGEIMILTYGFHGDSHRTNQHASGLELRLYRSKAQVDRNNIDTAYDLKGNFLDREYSQDMYNTIEVNTLFFMIV